MIVPAITVLAATLVAGLPWGLSAEGRLALPLVPFLVIHAWTLRAPGRVPEWLVFVCGITFDILTDGPLGYWAAVYLAGYAASAATAALAGQGVWSGWLHAAAILVLVAAVEGLLAAFYFGVTASWSAPLGAAARCSLAYPVAALLVRALARRSGDGEVPEIFQRGGAP